MKYIFNSIIFSLIPLASFGAEVVETCQLGDRPAHIIQITREHEIADSYIYGFQYGDTPPYIYGDPNTSRGLSVHIACAGKKQHALVVFGEFASNFLQGFVIVRNRRSGKLHRLDFAERSPPQWLYIGRDETVVVLPAHGSVEYSGKKYIVYRRANRDGAQAAISGSDVLPPSEGFEVTQLKGAKPR